MFQAQLFGKMAEENKNQIPIEDVTPDTFRLLKNLFYVTTVKCGYCIRCIIYMQVKNIYCLI